MFKVYRRGAARRAWRMGCRSHASFSPPALPPEAASSPPPTPRLRQFGLGLGKKKHARAQAREPPTQTSIGFLLAGRSGRFVVQKQRSGARPCFFPASCPCARCSSWAGCSLGAHRCLRSSAACVWAPALAWSGQRAPGGQCAPLTALPWWHRRAEGQGLAPMFGHWAVG